MKTFMKLSVAVFLLTSSIIANAQEKINISKKDGKLVWTGRKVMGEHTGTIDIKKGYLLWDGKEISGGEIVIDMTTIEDTDLEGDYKAKLEGHLKSDDFFGVENYPEATFNIKEVKHKKGNEYAVAGDLTVKGKTHAITFPAIITNKGEGLHISGTAEVDRSKYDVRYGSESFFDNLGDKVIDDIFDLNFDLKVAVKKQG